MTIDDSAPEPDSRLRGKIVSATELYSRVTPLHREDICSKLIVAHVAAMFIIGYVPLLFPLGILTTLGVVIVCVMALTGPIYKRQLDYGRGVLKQWGIGNKIAAVVLLLLFIGVYAFLIYWFFFRR